MSAAVASTRASEPAETGDVSPAGATPTGLESGHCHNHRGGGIDGAVRTRLVGPSGTAGPPQIQQPCASKAGGPVLSLGALLVDYP